MVDGLDQLRRINAAGSGQRFERVGALEAAAAHRRANVKEGREMPSPNRR
jgi:hypothetical protein